jgi:hypothetical protein
MNAATIETAVQDYRRLRASSSERHPDSLAMAVIDGFLGHDAATLAAVVRALAAERLRQLREDFPEGVAP